MERNDEFPLLLTDHHGVSYLVSEERLPEFFRQHVDDFAALWDVDDDVSDLRLLYRRADRSRSALDVLRFLVEWSAWTDELLRLRYKVNVL